MSEQLKPCPFCGNTEISEDDGYIMCQCCGAMIDQSDAENRDYVAAWNSRPEGTTSDKYRAELYDEVWQLARGMGHSNVTEALAAKDARIAELEAEVQRLDAGWHEANKQVLEQKLASQQAEPKGCTKPGCFPYCDCGTIDDYVSPAATTSEDGGEVPEVVEFHWPEYHAEGMGCGLEDRGIRDRYEAMQHGWDCALDRCAEAIPDEPLMTVAQFKRIVAAKDAEIARLENELSETELRALKFIHQCNAHVDLYRELRAERDELRAQLNAQPARNEVVIDLDALAWESIKEAANNSPWMPEQYMLNDWVADVCAFLREPARHVGGDELESWFHCPHCGTQEVSLERTCHSSSCLEYAYAKTVHEGWKARAALGKSDG